MIDGSAWTDAVEHQERILSIARPFDAVGSRKTRPGPHVTDEGFDLPALAAARNLSRHRRVIRVHADNNTASHLRRFEY